MISPCAVISTFQVCSVSLKSGFAVPNILVKVSRYWIPGSASSSRIIPENVPPMIPAKIAKIR